MKSLVDALLIVGLNLVIAYIAIIIYATYYTPGNPTQPTRIEVDTIGAIGIYIGITQLLYILPLLFFAVRSRQQNLVRGVSIGAILTALLNAIFLASFK